MDSEFLGRLVDKLEALVGQICGRDVLHFLLDVRHHGAEGVGVIEQRVDALATLCGEQRVVSSGEMKGAHIERDGLP